MQNQENKKIKIVCRIEHGKYQQDYYLDNQLQSVRSETVQGAERFLAAFSPETLLRKLAEQQENAVLVFRTSAAQMEDFCRVFREDTAESAGFADGI